MSVNKNGVEIEKFKLDNSAEIIKKYDNITVKITHGKVCILDSPCPDHDCVKAGYINKPGQMVVCLPERFCIRIDSEQGDVDAVAK